MAYTFQSGSTAFSDDFVPNVKQKLTSGYGTGLTTKQKRAVNIIQTPFQEIDATWGAVAVGTGAVN